MEKKLSIPQHSAKYILFQRTAYLKHTNSAWLKAIQKFIPGLSYERMVGIEARMRHAEVSRLYAEDMHKEYVTVQSYLPHECKRILDIGCGIAGFDVFLDRHYSVQQPHFFLLDRTHIEQRVFYMFKQKGAFYNSLEVAKENLLLNGIDANRVTTCTANDRNEIAVENKLDLVVSLISWGFHYPVSTYLDRAHELLRDGGRLIIDVRKETDGLNLIKEKFATCEIIIDDRKHVRIVATR